MAFNCAILLPLQVKLHLNQLIICICIEAKYILMQTKIWINDLKRN